MERKATWIWYPGDFEVWLGNKFNNRRTERGAVFPPFWKQDSHWPTVVFTTTADIEHEETLEIFSEGTCNAAIDGKLQTPESTLHPLPFIPQPSPLTLHPSPLTLHLPKGRHTLTLKVWNQQSPPAIFIDGHSVKTGSGWQVTFEDKIWIDEQGTAHGAGVYVAAASWCFDSPASPPSSFRLPTRPVAPVGSIPAASPVYCDSIETRGTLYDFDRETFGFLRFHGLRGEGTLRVSYGESREEALDREHCETLDVCTVSTAVCVAAEDGPLFDSKALRYACIDSDGTVGFDSITLDEEYAPYDPDHSGTFRSSDDELNTIWEVSARTLDLTTREFFTDGIKRDRWTWSGDAIQSYLMNYYLRFDNDCVKRTIRYLRGKDPVTAHVNTIVDYTFYWFISIADYYQYTGDTGFIQELWPRMVTLMDYVLSRTDADGMADGKPDDWVFVDWVDFPMHKRGALAFEQILFWKALKTMEQCAARFTRAVRLPNHATPNNSTPALALPDYAALAASLRQKIRATFWQPALSAYLHAIEDGTLNRQITKFPNIFAILYDLADEEEKALIADHVLLNPSVPPITTPYMRFYELEALCRMGMQAKVLTEMKDYWGGMIREGATAFWEKYNPSEHGTQHLAMYGRPYGKSLCHSWGAAPIYILGRYFLGVQPTKPGYEEYEVKPSPGGLQWMEGSVPTPFGRIHVEVNDGTVTVESDGGRGCLIAGGKTVPIPPGKKVTLKFADT